MKRGMKGNLLGMYTHRLNMAEINNQCRINTKGLCNTTASCRIPSCRYAGTWCRQT